MIPIQKIKHLLSTSTNQQAALELPKYTDSDFLTCDECKTRVTARLVDYFLMPEVYYSCDCGKIFEIPEVREIEL